MHKNVPCDLEAASLPEAQSPYVAGRHGRVDIDAALGVKKLDHGAGHARPIPLTAVFGIDVELRDHTRYPLPVGGLRRDQGHSEPNLAAVRNAPPDVPVLYLLREDVLQVPIQPLIGRSLASDLLAIAAKPVPELLLVAGHVLQLERDRGRISLLPHRPGGRLAPNISCFTHGGKPS